MTGPRIIGAASGMTQRQYNKIFNGCFSVITALGYSAACWYFDVQWYLTAIIVGINVHLWAAIEGNET